MKIFLDEASYDCLMKHLPWELKRVSPLYEAVRLGNTFVVDCDEAQIQTLLIAARVHCPEAATMIAGVISAESIDATPG